MEKEKRRDKGKPEPAKQPTEKEKEGIDIDQEMRRLEHEVSMERHESAPVTSSQQQQLETSLLKGRETESSEVPLQLPEWVQYPWMYVKPNKSEFVDSWLKDWSDLIIKWSQFNVFHVVGLKEFNTSKPFERLPEKELREVLQYLVDRGLGKWLDKDRTVIRIMWRSIEEWANEVFDWAYDNGVDMLDVFAIKSAKKDFSTLPLADIKSVMETMVKNKTAKWLDKKHEQAKLIFE